MMIRGWTPLGLFNTVTALLFNRVLVKMTYIHGTDIEDENAYKRHYWWEKADEYDLKVKEPG